MIFKGLILTLLAKYYNMTGFWPKSNNVLKSIKHSRAWSGLLHLYHGKNLPPSALIYISLCNRTYFFMHLWSYLLLWTSRPHCTQWFPQILKTKKKRKEEKKKLVMLRRKCEGKKKPKKCKFLCPKLKASSVSRTNSWP